MARDVSFLHISVCRHTDRTLSSSVFYTDAWRIVSEVPPHNLPQAHCNLLPADNLRRYADFPAYSQILTLWSPVEVPLIYLFAIFAEHAKS
jgi:hypothetical protein